MVKKKFPPIKKTQFEKKVSFLPTQGMIRNRDSESNDCQINLDKTITTVLTSIENYTLRSYYM